MLMLWRFIILFAKFFFRAEKLIGGLGGEKARWSSTAEVLNNSLGNIVGDVLLAAGAVAYFGPFPVNTRSTLVRLWNDKCLNLGKTYNIH